MKKIFFYFLAIFIIATACEKNEKAKKTDNTDKKSTEAVIDNTITQEAKIIYDDGIDSCGDVYMILIKDAEGKFNKQYKPNNLSNEYKKDGIYVQITYSLTSEYHNCGFGGEAQIIQIHNIKKIMK